MRARTSRNPKTRVYTPSEICSLFGISKSTLFRWERETSVRPTRDPRHSGQRLYSKQDLWELSSRQTKRMFDSAFQRDDKDFLRAAHERLAVIKLLSGQATGIDELEGLSREPSFRLRPEILQQLVQYVCDELSPEDPAFLRILKLVVYNCEQPTV